jgi:hypothetical protein
VHIPRLAHLLSNLLTLWFFATADHLSAVVGAARVQRCYQLNPFTHLAVSLSGGAVQARPFRTWDRLLLAGGGVGLRLPAGYFIFEIACAIHCRRKSER